MKVVRTYTLNSVDSADCSYWNDRLTFRSGDDVIEISLSDKQWETLQRQITERLKRIAKEQLEKAQKLVEANTDDE